MIIGMLTLVGVGSALVIDAAARELVADVRLAMKRADLTLDYVACVTKVPYQRLSDQLNAKTPFTSFWRFTCREIKETRFWPEFLKLQEERFGYEQVSRDLGMLIAKVAELVNHKPVMAKAALELPTEESRTA